jgi:hypothetical protein
MSILFNQVKVAHSFLITCLSNKLNYALLEAGIRWCVAGLGKLQSPATWHLLRFFWHSQFTFSHIIRNTQISFHHITLNFTNSDFLIITCLIISLTSAWKVLPFFFSYGASCSKQTELLYLYKKWEPACILDLSILNVSWVIIYCDRSFLSPSRRMPR